MVTLKGNTVFLRALEPEDLEFVYAIENNENIWEVSNTITPYSKWIFCPCSVIILFLLQKQKLLDLLEKHWYKHHLLSQMKLPVFRLPHLNRYDWNWFFQ